MKNQFSRFGTPVAVLAQLNREAPRKQMPINDFRASFRLAADDKHIATVAADGVALAVIQGLNEKEDAEYAGLCAENAELKRELSEIKQLLVKLSKKRTAP